MSDTETLPPIAVTPEQAQGMPQATRDALRAQYSRKYPADQVEAVFGKTAPAVHNNVTVPQTPGSHPIMSNSGISREQAIAGAKHLLAHGVPVETVAKAAVAHGLEPTDFAEHPSREAVATQQREAEIAEGFAPPAKGENYGLRFDPNFAAASEIDELAELNSQFESGFKQAGVPKELAQPLLDAFLSTGERYADDAMTEAGAETLWREERAMFLKAQAEPLEADRLAVLGFASLPQSMQQQLSETHAVHSASALAQLKALGMAIEYRNGRKVK